MNQQHLQPYPLALHTGKGKEMLRYDRLSLISLKEKQENPELLKITKRDLTNQDVT